uniref:Zinc binding alcohol dehydrogenase domain containing 2 n=1 Tax=Neogobius melanostomus TaxID=47308 RepID=A0A8C6SPN7_9GOBI
MSTSRLLSLRSGTAVLRLFRPTRGGKEALSVGPRVPARRYIIDMSYSSHFMDYKRTAMPSAMKKLVVTQLSPHFREAVRVQTVPVPTPGNEELLIRNRFVGINASDINYSAGRYDPTVKPPFDAGFEGIGEVVGLGLGASSDYTIGDTVAYFRNGAFAEYTIAPAKECIRVPLVKPEFLTLLVSGATAYIALKRLGDLTKGETVLVTAAKAGFLKSIGCDRPINYKEENLGETLRKEYPKGIDVVYESIGGSILDVAVNCLAQKGRLIVIGFISGYQSASGIPAFKGATLPVKLLQKSASMPKGELACEVDCGDMAEEGRFSGLESVFRAVDYMYAGKNLGKVVVEVAPAAQGNSKL